MTERDNPDIDAEDTAPESPKNDAVPDPVVGDPDDPEEEEKP